MTGTLDETAAPGNESGHDPTARPALMTYEVDPARLESGQWCDRQDKTIDEGDIAASYSADRIAMGQPVRKPFSWKGGLWVCVGTQGAAGSRCAKAYRLMLKAAFSGAATTYREKLAVDGGDAARADPQGFYDRMTVTHAGQAYVLCGPPALFVPGQPAPQQMGLFP